MGMSEEEMKEFLKGLDVKPPSPTVEDKPKTEEKKEKTPKTTKPRSTSSRSTTTTTPKKEKSGVTADEVMKLLKEKGYITKTELKGVVKTIEEEREKLAKKFEDPTKYFTFDDAYLWFVEEVKENPDKFASMMTNLKRWIDKEMEELLKMEAPEFYERWKMAFRGKASAETRKVKEIFDFTIQYVEQKLRTMLKLMDSVFFDTMLEVIGKSLK